MDLLTLAQQYQQSTALLRLRVRELQVARAMTRSPEVRFRLQKRILTLYKLIGEGQQIAHHLSQYYGRGENDAIQ